MLCGAHAQLALAAKRFCRLSEAEYLHYFYKVVDMVVVTKPLHEPELQRLAAALLSGEPPLRLRR
jgi:hypothetical protein